MDFDLARKYSETQKNGYNTHKLKKKCEKKSITRAKGKKKTNTKKAEGKM